MVKQATNLRRCLVCRTLKPKEQLLRVVRLAHTHTVQLSSGMGRSAYLCPSHTCWQQAQKKNRLGSALRAPVTASLYAELKTLLQTETDECCKPELP